MSEQNKAVVRRLIEDHWNVKNQALVGDLFAPTTSIHTPDGVFAGLKGTSSLLQAYATGFPDLAFHSVRGFPNTMNATPLFSINVASHRATDNGDYACPSLAVRPEESHTLCRVTP